MGIEGMFITCSSLEFNPMMEISTTYVWIRLLFIPLLCWVEGIFKAVRDKRGRFITSDMEHGNDFSCAIICVEMNFSRGLPWVIQLNLDGVSHL